MYKPRFIITNKINNELLEIILEAHHSTHIEGTQLTLSEAQKILAGKPVEGVRPDDRQELMNYKEAMDFVSEYLDIKSEITEEIKAF